MVPVCRSPRMHSGRRSEALNTAGSLLPENRAHLRATALTVRLAGRNAIPKKSLEISYVRRTPT